MTTLNLRLPADVKTALSEIGGTLSENAREALGQHVRAAVIASASAVPVSFVAFLLALGDEALKSRLTSDERADVMIWQTRVELAFSDARQGDLEAAAAVLGRIPETIKRRAAAMTSALEN